MKKIQTLCLCYNHPHILLGKKKRGFGMDKWNGFGGKVDEDETIEEAARRELKEETGIEAGELEKVGLIEFEFDGNPDVIEVHFFRVLDASGDPKEGEEMLPRWFHIDEIPFSEMWPDDRHWLPMFLAGKKFAGKFWFDKFGGEVADFYLDEVKI